MYSFGKKPREARETANLSQMCLTTKIGRAPTVIGKYGRNEMKPSIDALKKLTEEFDNTVGSLHGKAKETQLLKSPVTLKWFQGFDEPDDSEKLCVYPFLAKNKMKAF